MGVNGEYQVNTDSRGLKRVSFQRIAIGVVVLVVLTVIIVPIAYFCTLPNNDTQTGSTDKPNYAALPRYERIDCYPESRAGVDSVTRENCETVRGCVYDEQFTDVACYYPREKGYRGTNIDLGETGFKVNLRRSGGGPFPGNIMNIVFEVEEYGDTAVRFKVKYTCF